MKLPEASSPREERDENVIPMINIVFLLLIFFMLTGTLTPASPLTVEPAESTAALESSGDAVRVLIDEQGRLALDGAVVEDRAAFREELQALMEAGSERPVEVKADAEAESARLLAVMDDLREAGVERIELLARKER